MTIRNLLILLLLVVCRPVLAQADPASYQPVKEGDQWTFTDPVYGYAISYSDDFLLKADPKAMETAREVALDLLPGKSNALAGTRFSVGAIGLKTDGFVPNLSGAVNGVSPEAGLTNELWAQVMAEKLPDQLKATLSGPVQPVIINDVTFFRIDFQYVVPKKNRRLVCRTYCHYDEVACLKYAFTLSSTEQNAQRNLDALEAPMKTVRLAKQSGPVPADLKGPSGLLWPERH